MSVIVVDELVATPHPDAATLAALADAVDLQVHRDFCFDWGREPWHVTHAAGAPPEPNPSGRHDVIAHLVDARADVPGALAFHDDPGGIPDIYVMVGTILAQPGGSWLSGTGAVSVALAHEVLELIADPYCTFGAHSVDGRTEFALEVCDPVEGHSYDVTLPDGAVVAVSDYVLPGWFNATDTSGAPTDRLSVLHAPLTLDHGYAIVWTPGQPTQVIGEIPPDHGQRARRRMARDDLRIVDEAPAGTHVSAEDF